MRAAAAAQSAVASKSEDAVLSLPEFGAFTVHAQLLVLDALGVALAQHASADELAARPSAVAAGRRAVEMLAVALLPHNPTCCEPGAA